LKAVKSAISRAAIMIITSALILTVAGLSIFLVASNTIISEIGMLVGRGAFISMLMMFTLLPLLFMLCDRMVRHTSLGLGAGSFKRGGKTEESLGAEVAGSS
jgi:predicted RND superfamily exporter protein